MFCNYQQLLQRLQAIFSWDDTDVRSEAAPLAINDI